MSQEIEIIFIKICKLVSVRSHKISSNKCPLCFSLYEEDLSMTRFGDLSSFMQARVFTEFQLNRITQYPVAIWRPYSVQRAMKTQALSVLGA